MESSLQILLGTSPQLHLSMRKFNDCFFIKLLLDLFPDQANLAGININGLAALSFGQVLPVRP